MWQLPPDITPDNILYYLRKSRTDDPTLTVEEILANHEQLLDEWVERFLPGKGRVHETQRHREVGSSETIEGRPEVQAVLRKIESPQYKAVLIKDPQRLSRGDLEDIGRIVKLFRYTNTIVITLDYIYDLRDERDRSDFERELKKGNDYLEYTKKIMLAGRHLSVSKGNFIGNTAPYGYKKISYKDGKEKCHTLEPIPEQARVVKMIFELYRDGVSSHGVARELNKMAIPSPRGGKWSPESLKRMRCNEHYLGKVVWNRRQEVKSVEDGEVITSRPLSKDYLVYPGKHPAIIEQDLWDAVQEIRNKIPPKKGKTKYANPFAGLVYCKCGRPMSRRTYKNKEGKERNPPRLLCDGQAECGTASCYESEMVEKVIEILREAIADFELQIKDNGSNSLAIHQQLIEQQEKRLVELNKLEVAQWEKYTQEGMPKHIFDQLNEKVLAEKDEIREALCVMRGSIPEPVDYGKKKDLFYTALEVLLDKDAPIKEKNLLLKQCIERIEYTRKTKKGGNRRWGDPEPMELDVHLRV